MAIIGDVPGQPRSSRDRAEMVVRRNPTAAAEFQRKLADAIERLVDEETSYGELSVEQLINDAGIARSTFYKYFGDKSGLLASLVLSVRDDFLTAANAWLDMTAGGTRAEYEQSFRIIFAAYRTHRTVMRCIVEQSTQDAVIGAQFQEMMAVFVAAIEHHIRQGQGTGAIASSHSAAHLAVWLTWMLEFGQMKLIGPADERTVQKYTTAVTDIVWKTLYSDTVTRG